MTTFAQFALSKKLVEALKALHYENPTPIQEKVIPKALKGQSLLATSETGSGKTHAFLIPILEKIDIKKEEVQAIILSPTRELATQTFQFFKEFVPFFAGLRVRLLTSGEEKEKSIGKLKMRPHVLIATPGRIADFTYNDQSINFMTARYVVLDEADMLTEFGFLPVIDEVISRLIHPTILVFSATIKDSFVPFLDRYIQPEHRIFLSQKEHNPSRITHYAVDIKHQKEEEALYQFIALKQPYLCLVFASTKTKVNHLYEYLQAKNCSVGVLHGDLSSRERKQMMKRIIQNDFTIVVCSDMAARGLDLEGVSDIINMDLPKDLSFYFHRAGRTGRYDQTGNCYTFYNRDQIENVNRLLQAGVSLQYLSLKNQEIRKEKTADYAPKKKKINPELEKEIRKAVAKTKTNTVKPGYKKKVKLAVEKAKRQHKRKIIQQDIRKRQVQRAKDAVRKEKGYDGSKNW